MADATMSRICPVMSGALKRRCVEEKCMWWRNGDCDVANTKKVLAQIRDKLPEKPA